MSVSVSCMFDDKDNLLSFPLFKENSEKLKRLREILE